MCVALRNVVKFGATRKSRLTRDAIATGIEDLRERRHFTRLWAVFEIGNGEIAAQVSDVSKRNTEATHSATNSMIRETV